MQPIVTIRGAEHAFVCYPVGDDKLLAFFVDNMPLDAPLLHDPAAGGKQSASEREDSDAFDDPLNLKAQQKDGADEDEHVDMTRICMQINQLMQGIKM